MWYGPNTVVQIMGGLDGTRLGNVYRCTSNASERHQRDAQTDGRRHGRTSAMKYAAFSQFVLQSD